MQALIQGSMQASRENYTFRSRWSGIGCVFFFFFNFLGRGWHWYCLHQDCWQGWFTSPKLCIKRRELEEKMTNLPADLCADGVILMEVGDGMKRYKMERKTTQ